MQINSDFRDLLRHLNAAGTRYLIVGGYAVMIHTEPRYTKDLDVWVDPAASNAPAVFSALSAFGAPLTGLQPKDFTEPGIFYQVGVDPVRIDVLTSLSGVEFGSAWDRRVEVDFGGEMVPVVSREDLMIAKRAAGREQDLIDLKNLIDAAPPTRL